MELTPTEIEMIRLKRIEDDAKKKQKGLEEKLAYEKLVKDQTIDIEQQKSVLISKNKRIVDYFNTLVELGCGDNVSLEKREVNVIYNKYNTFDLRPEDKVVEKFEVLQINTTFGNIDNVETNNKAYLPYSISSRYQGYTASGCATKILEVVRRNKALNEEKTKREANKDKLILEFSKKYPKAEFTFSEKYNYNNYKPSKNEGWYTYYITISFPNKSWVKISYDTTGWTIWEKFDSKYIKPETKEDWLEYLAKE
jgi:hypothetical protein